MLCSHVKWSLALERRVFCPFCTGAAGCRSRTDASRRKQLPMLVERVERVGCRSEVCIVACCRLQESWIRKLNHANTQACATRQLWAACAATCPQPQTWERILGLLCVDDFFRECGTSMYCTTVYKQQSCFPDPRPAGPRSSPCSAGYARAPCRQRRAQVRSESLSKHQAVYCR